MDAEFGTPACTESEYPSSTMFDTLRRFRVGPSSETAAPATGWFCKVMLLRLLPVVFGECFRLCDPEGEAILEREGSGLRPSGIGGTGGTRRSPPHTFLSSGLTMTMWSPLIRLSRQ